MKKFTATIVLALFAIVFVSAQGCLPEGITFTTQAQIDSFQVNYPGCTEIEGNVLIKGGITSLEGLSVITSIGGNLLINKTTKLLSLTGLDNLTSVGGFLEIGCHDFPGNNTLSSLSSLGNLTSVGGYLEVSSNPQLTNLEGLGSITSIGGHLWIVNNDSLSSLAVLNNIDPATIEDIYIMSNDMLSECDVQSICDYLVAPNGYVVIEGNATGCNSIEEVEEACGICLPDGITFTTQEEIDNFQSNYPGCTEIEGGVFITGNDITNLDGLNIVTSIGGWLTIMDGDMMSSLGGLEGLTSVGHLELINNDALTSLEGLENIDPGSIPGLYIADNIFLNECDVQSICDYLGAPNGDVTIYNNAPGCNSIEEVEEACDSQGIVGRTLQSFTLHPNPTDNGFITITLDNPHNLQLSCFNTFGQQIYQQEISSAETVINVSTWTPGMYLAVLYEDGKPMGRSMFVVR